MTPSLPELAHRAPASRAVRQLLLSRVIDDTFSRQSGAHLRLTLSFRRTPHYKLIVSFTRMHAHTDTHAHAHTEAHTETRMRKRAHTRTGTHMHERTQAPRTPFCQSTRRVDQWVSALTEVKEGRGRKRISRVAAAKFSLTSAARSSEETAVRGAGTGRCIATRLIRRSPHSPATPSSHP